MIEATLCFVRRDEEVLLIEKRRGLGEGWYNGPGGKLETGETPRECARREVREEIDLVVGNLEKAAELTFFLDGEEHIFCHVYRTDSFEGVPRASPEARPEWVPIDKVPYDRMWDDDRHWLPFVLDGDTVSGDFHFEGDTPLDEATFVGHDIERGVEFDDH